MSIKLTGMDAEIFLKNLDRELTQEEINEIRAWACAPKVKEIEAQLNIKEKVISLLDQKIEYLVLSRKMLTMADTIADLNMHLDEDEHKFMLDLVRIPKNKKLQMIQEIEQEIPNLLEAKKLYK